MFDIYALDDEYGAELHVAHKRDTKTLCGRTVEQLRDREQSIDWLPSGTYCTACHLNATRELARKYNR